MKNKWIRSGVVAALSFTALGIAHAQSSALRCEAAMPVGAVAISQPTSAYPAQLPALPMRRMDVQRVGMTPIADDRVFDRQ